MNFQNIYIDNVNNDTKESLITSDDLLLKFLNYIEFWKQKTGNNEHIIFIFQCLRLYYPFF